MFSVPQPNFTKRRCQMIFFQKKTDTLCSLENCHFGPRALWKCRVFDSVISLSDFTLLGSNYRWRCWGTRLGTNRQRPSVRSSLARLLRRAGRLVSVASSLVNSKKIFPLELAFTLVTFEKCLLLNRFEPAPIFYGFVKGNIHSVLIFQDLLFHCCGHSDLRFWSTNFNILLVREREGVCYSFVCV